MNETRNRRRAGVKEEEPKIERAMFDETMALVKEATKGDPHREARLQVRQEDIITSSDYLLARAAEDWLKLPSGWPEMEFTIEDLAGDNGYKIEAVNIGANAGVPFRRSGFIIAANWIENIGRINVQIVYLPEDNEYREPIFDMQNQYWKRQYYFMEAVNRTGRNFADQLRQKPTANQLGLARNLINRAVNPEKPSRFP